MLTASSAAEALDLVQRLHVDVLRADIAMPGDDGYALLRKLRATGTPEVASVPAAALTAFARSEDRQQAIDAGFQLHLPKPIDLQSLVEAVTCLGRPGRSRDLTRISEPCEASGERARTRQSDTRGGPRHARLEASPLSAAVLVQERLRKAAGLRFRARKPE